MNLLRSLFGEDADILRDRRFQVLLLANVVAPMGTAVVSPILDSLIDPFGTSLANVGLLLSALTAPAIVTIPIAGYLSDRYGRKPLLVGSLLVFSSAGAAIALTTDFRTALALRALQGVGFGGIAPVIITSIGDVYGGPAEATAQGVRFTGSGLVQTVTPLLAGGLVLLTWQYPFALYAIGIPVAVAVALYFDEPTENEELSADSHGSSSDSVSTRRMLAALGRSPRAVALIVGRGLPMVIWMGFLTYNSTLVVQVLDGTPAHAGLIVALSSFTYAVGATQAGRLTAAFDSRFFPLVGTNVLLGVGFAVFLFAPRLPIAAGGVVLMGIGFGLALSMYRSIITGLAGQAFRGSVVSLGESFGRLVATVTPVAMGGLIGLTAPALGLQAALQSAGVAVIAVGAGGGLLCLFAARVSPPVPASIGAS